MSAVGCYERDLPRLVGKLPVARRMMLADGPMDDPDCRVCEALHSMWGCSTAARALLDFHGAEGKSGSACYRRCVAIYRAAGWTGAE